MGAADFRAYAFGKTPGEAFSAAVDQAKHEHGHGGYTGTIAEKWDFVHVALPKGVTLPTFVKLLHEVDSYTHVEYWREDLQTHARMGKGKLKRWGGRTLKQAQARYEREKRKADRFWSKVDKKPGLRKALENAHRCYVDKGGPAVCLGPVTGKALRANMSWAVGVRTNHTATGWNYRVPRGKKLWMFLGYASE